MKGISKAAHAGLSPLIPAVLAPPEALVQALQGFIPTAQPHRGAARNEGASTWHLRPAFEQAPSGQ
jgi:hypothetical protein